MLPATGPVRTCRNTGGTARYAAGPKNSTTATTITPIFRARRERPNFWARAIHGLEG
jgi:hypothetical protein